MSRRTVSDRKLRSRGARQTITDDVPELNDYIEGYGPHRSFSVENKLRSDKFSERFVRYMNGHEFTLEYVQKNGFFQPLVFREKTGLGLRVPSKSFSVDDVRSHVGEQRVIDVMDVSSQQALEMWMGDFADYFKSPKRTRLLNVISLEFSQTPMEPLIQSPRVVRKIDWVDKVWPHYLKMEQTEGTNQMSDMKYPKVQKYCLMSVGGSYTDFHIDFGGTSVWYHILRGQKVFWLIPPTPENLMIYEKWVKSGRQQDVFLGDLVEECSRIYLREGYTFFIPTGWIHAVFTPMDSLVFGGNFLHSFNIEGQLVVSDIEDRTKVPFKFRYPFFVEIMWHVIRNYVAILEQGSGSESMVDAVTEESVVTMDCYGGGSVVKQEVDEGESRQLLDVAIERSSVLNKLSMYEVQGLAALLFKMERTSLWRKRAPAEVADPEGLLAKLKELLNGYQIQTTYMSSELREERPRCVSNTHLSGDVWKDGVNQKPSYSLLSIQELTDHSYWRRSDLKRPKLMSTGGPRGDWRLEEGFLDDADAMFASLSVPPSGSSLQQDSDDTDYIPRAKAPIRRKRNARVASEGGHRQRKHRCGQCRGCVAKECRKCRYCLDMPKNGGTGRLRQACEKRKCLNMSLTKLSEKSLSGKFEESDDDDDKDNEDDEDDVDSEADTSSCDRSSVSSSSSLPRQRLLRSKGGRNALTAKSFKSPIINELDIPSFDFDENALDLMMSSVHGLADLTPDDLTLGGLAVASETDPQERKFTSPIFNRELKNDSKLQVDRSTGRATRSSKARRRPESKHQMKRRDSPQENCSNSKGNAVIRQLEEAQKMKSSFKIPLKAKRPDQSTAAPAVSEHHEHCWQRYQHSKDNHEGNIDDNSWPTPTDQGQEEDNTQTDSNKKKSPRRWSSVTKMSSSQEHHKEKLSSSFSNRQRRGHRPKSPPRSNSSRFPRSLSPLKKKEKRQSQSVPVLKVAAAVAAGEREAFLSREGCLPVFKYLSQSDLFRCMLVCRTWQKWASEPVFWRFVDLSCREIIPAATLASLKRRRAGIVDLSWSGVSQRQLRWICNKVASLWELRLTGCPKAVLAAFFRCEPFPRLSSLDLGWIEGLDDRSVRGLFGSDGSARDCALRELRLTGSTITDDSLGLLSACCFSLTRLDLSYCSFITDRGIDSLLSTTNSPACRAISCVNLAGCGKLTDKCVGYFHRCTCLQRVDLRSCGDVSLSACLRFAASSSRLFVVREENLIELQSKCC